MLIEFIHTVIQWNFCLWRTKFCQCCEMTAWFIGMNFHTSGKTELDGEQKWEDMFKLCIFCPPSWLFFSVVVNHCIKYQAKMNYSVRNFEDNLLGCFRFMSVSNKVVKWGAGGHPASSWVRKLLSDEILTDFEPKTSQNSEITVSGFVHHQHSFAIES